jgi:hypothetical protein
LLKPKLHIKNGKKPNPTDQTKKPMLNGKNLNPLFLMKMKQRLQLNTLKLSKKSLLKLNKHTLNGRNLNHPPKITQLMKNGKTLNQKYPQKKKLNKLLSLKKLLQLSLLMLKKLTLNGKNPNPQSTTRLHTLNGKKQNQKYHLKKKLMKLLLLKSKPSLLLKN